MGARRYRVMVDVAVVVAVLEWCQMRGVRVGLDVSDGWHQVVMDVVSGWQRMWWCGGGVRCVRCRGAGAANVVLEWWQTQGCWVGSWCRGNEVAVVFMTESGGSGHSSGRVCCGCSFGGASWLACCGWWRGR